MKSATEAYWLGYMIAVLREEQRLLRLQKRDLIVDLMRDQGGIKRWLGVPLINDPLSKEEKAKRIREFGTKPYLVRWYSQ